MQRVRDEERDVAAPFTQRRHVDLDHGESVVEVVAQRGADLARTHDLVRRGDDPRGD